MCFCALRRSVQIPHSPNRVSLKILASVQGISDELNNIDSRPFDEIVLTPEDYRVLYQNGYANLIEESYSEAMNKTYYKMALEKDGSIIITLINRAQIKGRK